MSWSRPDLPLESYVIETGVPELDLIFQEPPADGGMVTTGEITLRPNQARELLFGTAWRAQRNMNSKQLAMLADFFRNEEFLPHSLLSFGFLPTGSLVMVDGHHRLEASIRAGWTGPWMVRLDWATSAYDLYARLDSYQVRRTAAIQGRAYQDDELVPMMRQRGMEAARWQMRWSHTYSLPHGCVEPPLRDVRERMLARMDSLVAVQELGREEEASLKVYRKLVLGSVLAVVAETIHVLPEGAVAFWRSVLRLEGGMSRELAQVLLEPVPPRQARSYLPRMAAQAWNRRAQAGQLRQGARGQGARRHVSLQGSDLRVGQVLRAPPLAELPVGPAVSDPVSPVRLARR